MTRRIALRLVLALGVIAIACLSAHSARDEAPSNWLSLEQRYAEANLELAKARLDMAQTQNKAAAGAVTKQMMDELQSGVQFAQDQLKQLVVNRSADSRSPQIAALEGVIQALEINHAESLKANQPGAVSEAELRREQAEISLAKARLAALKALPQQSPQVRVEWEIRMLHDDVRALWARPLIED